MPIVGLLPLRLIREHQERLRTLIPTLFHDTTTPSAAIENHSVQVGPHLTFQFDPASDMMTCRLRGQVLREHNNRFLLDGVTSGTQNVVNGNSSAQKPVVRTSPEEALLEEYNVYLNTLHYKIHSGAADPSGAESPRFTEASA